MRELSSGDEPTRLWSSATLVLMLLSTHICCSSSLVFGAGRGSGRIAAEAETLCRAPRRDTVPKPACASRLPPRAWHPPRRLLLRLVPRTYLGLLHKAERREVEPLPHACATAFADPQPANVFAATSLDEVQAHGLTVRRGRMIVLWIPKARPQHARRGHADDLRLGLEHRILLGQLAQTPLSSRLPAAPPRPALRIP